MLLARAHLTKPVDHRAVRKRWDLQLNYHIDFLQGLPMSESRREEALSVARTWAYRSSVICMCWLELAREKSARCINPTKYRLRCRGLAYPAEISWETISFTNHTPREKTQSKGPAAASRGVLRCWLPRDTQTPQQWLGLSRELGPSLQGWTVPDPGGGCWQSQGTSSRWQSSSWVFTLFLRGPKAENICP